MTARITLHVVGTDVLLWALGGFDDEPQRNSRGRHSTYTLADLDLIRSFYWRFARPNGRLEHGKARQLAALLDRDPVALRNSISKMRRRGALPPLRGAA
jgi:hypothetical protein